MFASLSDTFSPTFYEQLFSAKVFCASFLFTYLIFFGKIILAQMRLGKCRGNYLQVTGVYNVPWPAKKLLAKLLTQVCLQKFVQTCTGSKAKWCKLTNNEIKKQIIFVKCR